MSEHNPVIRNIPAFISGFYNSGDLLSFKNSLEYLLMLENEWKKNNFSDGFYIYYQIKNLIEKSIHEQNTDMTSFLLSFRNSHFGSEFMDSLEENETDILFGIKELPPIYYSPGSIIEFGNYYWSDIPGAPLSPIQWESLTLQDDHALLISKYGIDTRPYNNVLEDVTWENCSLRKWLNSDFFDQAFSPEEQSRIIESSTHNPDAGSFIKGGNDTSDRVFLLSTEEIAAFDDSPENSFDFIKKASPFAKKSGADIVKNDICKWLLRSPGNMWMSASFIDYDGSIDDRGVYVQNSNLCICPALRLKIHNC